MIVETRSKSKPKIPPGRKKKGGPRQHNGLFGGDTWADAGLFGPEKKKSLFFLFSYFI